MPLLDGYTRPQLAEALDRSPQTLARWANEGTGPGYRIIMGRAFYPTTEVQAWLDAQPVHNSAQEVA